ncbi:MAG TPA: hypothetical protein VK634_15035 [Reyranella sp.]|nr:hypothetical protein [Reyranella sp.]HTE81999.1 hypothetical protein [Reyranella sp.]
MKAEIIANFRVWAPDENAGREKRIELTRGMVLDESEIPAGQSLQDWIDKGLAKAVQAARAGDESAQEAGAAV